ncbi:MAG TPA: hypothetical protein VE914_11685, partial [Candidatus Angelobacter sp.]|nr:hypothetical protein [Candidatus Angelobacter sp.]
MLPQTKRIELSEMLGELAVDEVVNMDDPTETFLPLGCTPWKTPLCVPWKRPRVTAALPSIRY